VAARKGAAGRCRLRRTRVEEWPSASHAPVEGVVVIFVGSTGGFQEKVAAAVTKKAEAAATEESGGGDDGVT
jgi:hypothetical protein